MMLFFMAILGAAVLSLLVQLVVGIIVAVLGSVTDDKTPDLQAGALILVMFGIALFVGFKFGWQWFFPAWFLGCYVGSQGMDPM